MGVADTEITPLEVEAQAQDSDADAKYVKRQSGFQRSLKRFFPSAFQPTLPVTTRRVLHKCLFLRFYISQQDPSSYIRDVNMAFRIGLLAVFPIFETPSVWDTYIQRYRLVNLV